MVAAGEAGGILDVILQRLSTYLEKAVKLQGAGQVGPDLPDSTVISIATRRGVDHPLEGDSGLRPAVRRPRRRAALLTQVVVARASAVGRYSWLIYHQ